MYINQDLEAINLKQAFPNTSFPAGFEVAEIDENTTIYKVFPYEDHPAYEAPGEFDVQESEGFDIVGGKAYRVVTFREMTIQERAHKMLGIIRANKATIDAAVENKRLQYITPGSGQSMAYEQKYQEAVAFQAAQNPDPEDYPHLQAEIGITAADAAGVAAVIIGVRDQWIQLSAGLEGIRLGYKKALDDAETPTEAHAAMMAFQAALESI